MTRRVLPLACAFVLAFAAVACAKPPQANIGFEIGRAHV